MTHPNAGAGAKIARATEHLETVEGLVDSYLGARPIRVENEQESDGTRRLIRWVAKANTQPPAALGPIVGDWAHNVRGALDYTVYELVRRETTVDDPRWTQFPIAIERAQYDDQAKHRLRGAPAWSLPVFEGLQPFHDGAAAGDDPLAVLADISNRDKHRLLHTAAMQVAGSQARVSGRSVMAIHGLAQNPGAIGEERVILEALLETDGDDFRIEMEVQLAVALERHEAVPIVPLLAVITNEVEAIVEWFEPALADGP